jgi:signal transduction histidine kinase
VLLSAFARQAALLIENQRRQAQMNLIQKLIYDIQVGLQDEKRLLQRIVDGVVQDLGYVGAMLATREAGEALPVRAYHVDPAVVTAQQIHEWEDRLGARIGDEATARVYINQLQYKSNLSVLAAEIGKPVTSDFLFDLFTPIVPDVARPVVMGLQEALGIQHVIAVPFFLETRVDGGLQRELVGNLFAATRSRRFSASEIEILTQFGNQAAAGIRNARLYRLSEERRNVALIFARMAFSAAANVHDLRNHVAVVKTPLSMLEFVGKATQPEMREKALTGALEMLPNARDRIQVITELLDSLHEPWRHVTDKVYRSGGLPQHLEEDYTEPLPDVRLSPDMLIEAFRIVIKNAMEAMQYQPEDLRYLKVETCLDETRQFIMIKIRDSGRGIAPENLSKVFEMRWSTKSYGMGFGLFWAKDFIEGLGGSIQVDSRPDEGAAFIFRIPVQPVTINAITE